MIKTEFGIIEELDPAKHCYDYEPEKYHCVAIDDDAYINDWWPRLVLMKTYFGNLRRPEFGLARWGVTLIPPESLPAFQDIVLSEPRLKTDPRLAALAEVIRDAIERNKYMINLGI